MDNLETITEISRMLLTLSCALNSNQNQSIHPLNGLNTQLNRIFLFLMMCYAFDNEQGSMQQFLLAVVANCMASLWMYLQQKPEKICPLATALCKPQSQINTKSGSERHRVRHSWFLVEHNFNSTQDSVDSNWLWTKLSLFLFGLSSVCLSFIQKDPGLISLFSTFYKQENQ